MKAKTSTTTDTENDSLVDEIKKYKTDALIEFLQKEEDLDLDNDDLEVIRKQKINGRIFFKITIEELQQNEMKLEFAKECKKKRKRPYSSYKTQKEKVLSKFGIDGNSIKNISPFIPSKEKISDDDKDFQFCIEDIKRKMEIIGPVNEAIRCIYIEAILICAIFIVKRKIKEKISLESWSEIVGKETRQVDYTIKKTVKIMNLLIYKELISITKASEAFNDDNFDYLYGIVSTATDWYFTIYMPDKFYCTKTDYHIDLTKDILENDMEFCQGLKKVMEVIVGLLIDKVEADDSSVNKRIRTKKYIKE